jgi:hypothetical protein
MESTVIVSKENIRNGLAYGAGFAGRLAGRRITSTALAISESLLDNLKASKATEIALGMDRLWSKGKLSAVKSGKTKIIVDDTAQIVDTLVIDCISRQVVQAFVRLDNSASSAC